MTTSSRGIACSRPTSSMLFVRPANRSVHHASFRVHDARILTYFVHQLFERSHEREQNAGRDEAYPHEELEVCARRDLAPAFTERSARVLRDGAREEPHTHEER